MLSDISFPNISFDFFSDLCFDIHFVLYIISFQILFDIFCVILFHIYFIISPYSV